MPRALLEGEAAGVLQNIIKWLKDKATRQKSPAEEYQNFQPRPQNELWMSN